MLVTLSENRFGHVTVRPVSESRRRAIAADMERNGASPSPDNGTIYIQSNAEDELQALVGKRAFWRGEVNDNVHLRVDDHTYRCACGYHAG